MLIADRAEGLHRTGEGWKYLEQTLVLGDADGLKLQRERAASFVTPVAPGSNHEFIRQCEASLEWGRKLLRGGFLAQRPFEHDEDLRGGASLVTGRPLLQFTVQFRG